MLVFSLDFPLLSAWQELIRNWARWSEMLFVMFPDTVFALMPLCWILFIRVLDRHV